VREVGKGSVGLVCVVGCAVDAHRVGESARGLCLTRLHLVGGGSRATRKDAHNVVRRTQARNGRPTEAAGAAGYENLGH
jgi:hypothetical protein